MGEHQGTMSNLVDKAKNFVTEKIADIPKPEATVNSVSYQSVARDGVTYHANVAVKNPYPHPLPVCEVSYVLKSNGQLLMSGNLPDPGSLPGKETTDLSVPMKVPHSAFWVLAKDVCTDWDIDYELEIGLIIDLPVVGSFTIPLSSKGQVKLPTLKDYFTGGGQEEAKKEDK